MKENFATFCGSVSFTLVDLVQQSFSSTLQSQLNMRVVLQVFSKPPKILLARGYGLNKREQNVNLLMKKVIPRSARLI